MRAFIFDLDGTLLDTLQDIAAACNAMLAAHGYPEHDTESYRQRVGNGFGKLVRRALPADALDLLQKQAPDEQAIEVLVQEAREIYSRHSNDSTRPYPGIPEALAELQRRGVCLGVLSNKTDVYTRALIEAHFPGVFCAVRGARKDTPLKPAPDGAFAVIAATGATPDQCFYVGDSDVDMITARRAGMTSVGVAWGFRGLAEVQQAGADIIVHHPREIPALLDR